MDGDVRRTVMRPEVMPYGGDAPTEVMPHGGDAPRTVMSHGR